jgi:hypothetical protein
MMAWIRYESGVLKHPKWQAIPFASRASAMAFHVACSGYSGDFLTDGYVPDNILPSIAHEAGVKEVTKTLTNLRNARLIRKVRGGILIHDYLDYNPSAEDVKKRRAEDAARKKAAREAASQEEASLPPSAPPSGPPSGPPSNRNPKRRLAGARTGADGRAGPVPELPSEPLGVGGSSTVSGNTSAADSARDAPPPPIEQVDLNGWADALRWVENDGWRLSSPQLAHRLVGDFGCNEPEVLERLVRVGLNRREDEEES